MAGPIGICIHGGCGTLDKSLLTPAEWTETRAHLAASLRAAWAILHKGGSALDAVEAAVVVMEDSPHFNAGHGAALTADSTHELDASIMDGATKGAGAVCTVKRIRNPIKAARAVMERSDCVLIAGNAADEFAKRQGLAIVENAYFTTQRRVDALASLKRRAASGTLRAASEAERHGTVGAVALDRAGNLAAATSTGGFNNKPVGRVGDTPIVGAGTYARNGVVAVSGTGQGEFFIRNAAAYDIAARMDYGKHGFKDSVDALVFDVLKSHGIGAGFAAIDAKGHVYAPYNTLGMARGWIADDGRLVVATHAEEFTEAA